jgi:hypothetical protein
MLIGGNSMRVSQLFGISGSQGTFDFIDVDVEKDTPLFIDPAVLTHLNSPWAQSCAAAVQGFFQSVLDKIVAGDGAGARSLLSHLGEENATHLGYSGESRGSGVGQGLAERFYEELSTSEAVRTGLITDLEDTALLVEGVREDRISDVVTNIIRRQLVDFTQDAARFYGIPLSPGVAVGPYWDTARKSWKQDTFDLPVTAHGPLILVPKAIVRRSLFFNPGEYYTHYVLEYLKVRELNDAQSPLVYLVKGSPRVLKKDVEAKARRAQRGSGRGIEKRINVETTKDNPDLLAVYKRSKSDEPPSPQPHEVIAEVTGTVEPDLQSLLKAVHDCSPGDADAHKYERAVEALLSALFYPTLANPIRQEAINEGRKIIDITFTNTGGPQDFFGWLGQHFPAANIVVECKNYTRPLKNPEYDQIAGRFSPSRGKYGILVYRSLEDRAKLLASCRDAAKDDRGFITALDDHDLSLLVDEALAQGSAASLGGLLHQRFKELIA